MLITTTGLLQFVNFLKDKQCNLCWVNENGLLVCWLCWYLEPTCDAAQSTTHQLYFQMSIPASLQHLWFAIHSMLERNQQTFQHSSTSTFWFYPILRFGADVYVTEMHQINKFDGDHTSWTWWCKERDDTNQGLGRVRDVSTFIMDLSLCVIPLWVYGAKLWDKYCCLLLEVTSFVKKKERKGRWWCKGVHNRLMEWIMSTWTCEYSYHIVVEYSNTCSYDPGIRVTSLKQSSSQALTKLCKYE